MPKFEYKTELLTTMVGREKLRMDDLDGALRRHGDDGWELASLNLDVSLRGRRDGHLLIFKRAIKHAAVPSTAEPSEAEIETAAEAGDPWSQGWVDATRATGDED
jgi:hypothetical protein